MRFLLPLPILAAVLLSLFAGLFEDAANTVDIIERLLSTEKILTIILLYVTLWGFPRQVWPFITKQIMFRQQAEAEYKLAQLASQERMEELLIESFGKITRTQEQIAELLTIMNQNGEKINAPD